MVRLTDLDADRLSAFPDYDGHERVVLVEDDDTGLRAFIAVHNLTLGPSLGGCRMRSYASDDEAIEDVLRLSHGMTYKNALANLPLGGGKTVVLGNPYTDKTDAMMRALGRAVAALDGIYITAEDSGTGEHDMIEIAKETSFVGGLPDPLPGDLGGNPSPITAFGVFSGIQSAVQHFYGHTDLSGLKVAVQGLGAVGYELCRLLHEQGVQLIATDIRENVLEQAQQDMPGLQVVGADDIFAVEANIFAPCALGAQINGHTIPLLHVDIVAGAANNQLAGPQHGALLAERGILYVPDFVLNAGGVIAVAYEYFARTGRNPFSHELNRDNMLAHVEQIGPTLNRIFEITQEQGITTAAAADRLAESIFAPGTGDDRQQAAS